MYPSLPFRYVYHHPVVLPVKPVRTKIGYLLTCAVALMHLPDNPVRTKIGFSAPSTAMQSFTRAPVDDPMALMADDD